MPIYARTSIDQEAHLHSRRSPATSFIDDADEACASMYIFMATMPPSRRDDVADGMTREPSAAIRLRARLYE